MKRMPPITPTQCARAIRGGSTTHSKLHIWEPCVDSGRPRHRGPLGKGVAVRVWRLPGQLIAGLIFVLGALWQSHALATPLAMAQFTDISLGGGEFQYDLTLQDTGTTAIGTFWNAWVPGKDFMAVSPTDIDSPTGWTEIVTHGGASDGYAIQWTTSSALLEPGNSVSFSFESTVAPAAMEGDSVFYPTTPVETTFVYSGAPFSDAGDQFIVEPASVPEPSEWGLCGIGAICILTMSGRLKDAARCSAVARRPRKR